MTKNDVSPGHIIAHTALLKADIEKALEAADPTPSQHWLCECGYKQSALQCFNALSHDQDVSAVQVASMLLDLPRKYTPNDKTWCINLWSLQCQV